MPYTEAQKRATIKYMKNNYDELRVKLKKGNKGIIEEAAQKENKSVTSFVIEAIDKELTLKGNPSILEKSINDEGEAAL